MKLIAKNSRKTLHLRRERSLDTTSTVDFKRIDTANDEWPSHAPKTRIIEIRYRCGKAIAPAVTDTALDMRKQCFFATGMHRLD